MIYVIHILGNCFEIELVLFIAHIIPQRIWSSLFEMIHVRTGRNRVRTGQGGQHRCSAFVSEWSRSGATVLASGCHVSGVRREWGYCRLFLLSVGDSLIVLQENKSVFLYSCSKTTLIVHLISQTFLKETSRGGSTEVQNSDSSRLPDFQPCPRLSQAAWPQARCLTSLSIRFIISETGWVVLASAKLVVY